jgi:23S rRNA (cytidine1920-2'-O)/16S rRNA (cytidine1409-2'-O)-methyltransferase
MTGGPEQPTPPYPNPSLPAGAGSPGEGTGSSRQFVSRAGLKLDHALNQFGIDVRAKTCADLGSNVGGFVDCLLHRGAAKVYAVDTGYGALEWKLRRDSRVVTMERTNAIHVILPESVQIVTIDVAWTRQRIILPAARRLVQQDGDVVTLIKPHYEAQPSQLRRGVLPPEQVEAVVDAVRREITAAGFDVIQTVTSPITGQKGNVEVLAHLRPIAGYSNLPTDL